MESNNFSFDLTNKNLLFNNILLLEEILKTHKINIDKQFFNKYLFFLIKRINQKGYNIILHFLLKILTNGESEQKLLLCFPNRNSQDNIEFRKICFEILKELEKEEKLPKNFIVGKSILDVSFDSEKIISFLKLLSEFTLKYFCKKQYPDANLANFSYYTEFFDEKNKENHKNTTNSNNNFSIFSLMDENLLKNKINEKQLNFCIESCENQINMNYYKLLYYLLFIRFVKICKKFNFNTNIYKNSAENLVKIYKELQNEKKFLKEENEKNKKNINKKYFTQNASLDRVPKIDLSNQVCKEVNEIHEKIIAENILAKIDEIVNENSKKNSMNEINFDIIGVKNKENKEIVSINDKFKEWKDNLDMCRNKKVDEIKKSEDIHKKLKGFVNKLERNKECLLEIEKKINE